MVNENTSVSAYIVENPSILKVEMYAIKETGCSKKGGWDYEFFYKQAH